VACSAAGCKTIVSMRDHRDAIYVRSTFEVFGGQKNGANMMIYDQSPDLVVDSSSFKPHHEELAYLPVFAVSSWGQALGKQKVALITTCRGRPILANSPSLRPPWISRLISPHGYTRSLLGSSGCAGSLSSAQLILKMPGKGRDVASTSDEVVASASKDRRCAAQASF
jgi:hypothetical protein